MDSEALPRFEKPGFSQRLRGMLGVDFYRLFHTPMFYIFLAVAAVIPAMILGTSGGEGGETALFTNTWQLIAASAPLYTVSDIGEYANMNMVFIFGGIMVSIFIGHDYRSGYVKQLFTTHAKKRDYMFSKTLSCAFAMACMCLTYLLGTVFAGALVGASMAVDPAGLLFALLGKLVMSLGWAGLYAFLNILFRRQFGVSIVLSFFFGTGLPVIAAGAALGASPLLNLFLYGGSVCACLSVGAATVLGCLAVSLGWAIFYNLLGCAVLARSDVY